MKPAEGSGGLAAAIGASLAALSLAFSPAATRDAVAQIDSPALWRVTGPKGKVFLFGSSHLLPAGVKWRTAAVDRALNEAEVVVFETDPSAPDPKVSQALIAKYGFLPPGQVLRSVLSTSTHAELEKAATDLGIPPASLAPLRPWLAAVTLTEQSAISQGFDPNNGVEQQVITWAKANGKGLVWLETYESQLKGVFADLTREQEIALLAVTLRQLREMPKMLEETLTAYRKGDLKTLESLLNIGLDDFPTLRKRILKDRHDKWLPQIERMIADARTHVVIVGVAHLVGPDSVIAMLRAKGVNVEGP
jgi:uncharacterized protein YbaP (TraB family)